MNYSQFVTVDIPSYEPPSAPDYRRAVRKQPSRRPFGRSGLKGVYLSRPTQRKPWQAIVRNEQGLLHLGYFRTKEEAARTYNEHALKIHGPDTYLNPV